MKYQPKLNQAKQKGLKRGRERERREMEAQRVGSQGECRGGGQREEVAQRELVSPQLRGGGALASSASGSHVRGRQEPGEQRGGLVWEVTRVCMCMRARVCASRAHRVPPMPFSAPPCVPLHAVPDTLQLCDNWFAPALCNPRNPTSPLSTFALS